LGPVLSSGSLPANGSEVVRQLFEAETTLLERAVASLKKQTGPR
jgi:hypothetical protein